MNKGGNIDYGWCQVAMVNADHTSCCVSPDGNIENGGDPAGFVITIPSCNARVYHAGDTNVFMDMELIEELFKPNVLLIPIGDRFTMGPKEAALAVKRFFKSAQYIFPMHYGTFPLLTGTPEAFKACLQEKGVDTSILVDTELYKKEAWVSGKLI